MRTIFIILLSLIGFLSSAQQKGECIFKFNSIKFQRDYDSFKTKFPDKNYIIKLYNPNGESISFEITENKISDKPINGIRVFKGRSLNEGQLISFTSTKKGILGSFSDNAKEVYFEPVSDKSKKLHKSYYLSKSVVGQENDFIK